METRSLLLASILLLGFSTPATAIVPAPEFPRAQRVKPLNTLAQGQQTQTDPRLQEADRLQQQVIQLYQQGRYAEGIAIAQQVLEIRESILGDHPDTATILLGLGLG